MVSLLLTMVVIINVWPRNTIVAHTVSGANLVVSVAGILWPTFSAIAYALNRKEG